MVYFVVGVLALLVAFGNRYGATTDEQGVLRRVLEQENGDVLLFVLALGLFCYAIWRILQCFYDQDGFGKSFPALSLRCGFLFSGVAHAILGGYALALIYGLRKQEGGNEKMMAHWMLLQPLGRFVLIGIGIGVVITGFGQFVRAFRGTFLLGLRLPKRGYHLLVNVCRFGIVARGIVFVIIGVFFLNAGWKERSREIGGLHKAWETLRMQPYGNYLLGIVAVGFMAFAIFGLIEGFYRSAHRARKTKA